MPEIIPGRVPDKNPGGISEKILEGIPGKIQAVVFRGIPERILEGSPVELPFAIPEEIRGVIP